MPYLRKISVRDGQLLLATIGQSGLFHTSLEGLH